MFEVSWRSTAVSALVLLTAVATSCTRNQTPVQAKATDGSAQTVPVARVSRATITSKTVLTAEFQPFQEVDVMAKVAGYIRSIRVDLGDHVRQGQVLAE